MSGSLDFFSDDFDAARALATPGLEPPDPDAQPLDYLAKCRVLLPEDMPESLAGKERAHGEKQGNESTRQKHEQLKEKALTAIQRIEQSCKVSLQGVMECVKPASPLSCLKRWHAAGARVRVVTRHACGARGVAEGRLVAYDYYCNLVLQDVQERYTVLVKVPKYKPAAAEGAAATQGESSTGDQRSIAKADSSLAKPEIKRWVRKQEHRQRQLGQVFIKGDNVVAVSCAVASNQQQKQPVEQ